MATVYRFRLQGDRDKADLGDDPDLDSERQRLHAEVGEEVSGWCEQVQIEPGNPPYYGWNVTEDGTEEMATKIRTTWEWEGEVS